MHHQCPLRAEGVHCKKTANAQDEGVLMKVRIYSLLMAIHSIGYRYSAIGNASSWIILFIRSANERWRYTVTPSFISSAIHRLVSPKYFFYIEIRSYQFRISHYVVWNHTFLLCYLYERITHNKITAFPMKYASGLWNTANKICVIVLVAMQCIHQEVFVNYLQNFCECFIYIVVGYLERILSTHSQL